MMLFVAVLILAASTIQVDSVPHGTRRAETYRESDEFQSWFPTRHSFPAPTGYLRSTPFNRAEEIESSDDSEAEFPIRLPFSESVGKPKYNKKKRFEKFESIDDELQTQLSRFLVPGLMEQLESKKKNSTEDSLGINEFLRRLERSEVNTENSYSVVANYILNLSPENYENLKKLVHRIVPLVPQNSLIGNFVNGFAFLTENRPMLLMFKNVLDVLNQGKQIVHGPSMAPIKHLIKFPVPQNEDTAENGSESQPKQGENDENVVDKPTKTEAAIPEDIKKVVTEHEEPGKPSEDTKVQNEAINPPEAKKEAFHEAGLPISDTKTEAAQLQNVEPEVKSEVTPPNREAEKVETATLQGVGPTADTDKSEARGTRHTSREPKAEETNSLANNETQPAANADPAEPKKEEMLEVSTPQKDAEKVVTAASTRPTAKVMENGTTQSRKSNGRSKKKHKKSKNGSQTQANQRNSDNVTTRSVGV